MVRSKAQRRAAGVAYAVRKGKIPKSKLRGASREMYESMKLGDLREFASHREKGLPEKRFPERRGLMALMPRKRKRKRR